MNMSLDDSGELEQFVFTMRLRSGHEDEYRRRHDAIWPELVSLLHASGLVDYRIYLDRETGLLTGVVLRARAHGMDDFPAKLVMQRWWRFMADIMETLPNGEPRTWPLEKVFELPRNRLPSSTEGRLKNDAD